MISETKFIIVLVGLPARGKTYISKRLTRYLNWIGFNTKTINVGDYRRKVTQEKLSDFFDHDNTEARLKRRKAAESALEDIIEWFRNEKGEIGVFDATNSTRSRRQMIYNRCLQENISVIFVESICDNKAIIQENIMEVKINSPDYQNMDADEAVLDFQKRIEHYEKVYESIDEDLDAQLSFIKIIDQGEKFILNKIKGSIPSRVVYFLMNIRVGKRSIYITRHGESLLNVAGRIGGDADLSERGWKYSKLLASFMEQQCVPNLKVWTSYFKRTIQTASSIKCCEVERWKALNEIDAGVCEEMTYEEIEQKYPKEFLERDKDKYRYRYPMGESYQDLVARLEPVIIELERQNNILVVCHQAVARCLLAYFEDKLLEDLPYVEVPLHTVIKLSPTAYRCIREEITLDVSAVNTHRAKPDTSSKLSDSNNRLNFSDTVHGSCSLCNRI